MFSELAALFYYSPVGFQLLPHPHSRCRLPFVLLLPLSQMTDNVELIGHSCFLWRNVYLNPLLLFTLVSVITFELLRVLHPGFKFPVRCVVGWCVDNVLCSTKVFILMKFSYYSGVVISRAPLEV